MATTFTIAAAIYGAYISGLPRPLNEIGDTLSGFAGALAFIWLVGTYYLQHVELSNTRKEYTKMRINMDRQAELASQENLVHTVQLYLQALDNAAENFQNACSLIFKSVFKRDPNTITAINSFGYLANGLEMATGERRKILNQKLERYVMPLNREVHRYRAKYKEMMDHLARVSGGENVRKILIDGSVYADVYEKLNEASRGSKLTQRVFGNNA